MLVDGFARHAGAGGDPGDVDGGVGVAEMTDGVLDGAAFVLSERVAIFGQALKGFVRRWGSPAAHRVVAGSALRTTDSWLPRVLICIKGSRLAVPAPLTLFPFSAAGSVRRRSMIASREAISRRRRGSTHSRRSVHAQCVAGIVIGAGRSALRSCCTGQAIRPEGWRQPRGATTQTRTLSKPLRFCLCPISRSWFDRSRNQAARTGVLGVGREVTLR